MPGHLPFMSYLPTPGVSLGLPLRAKDGSPAAVPGMEVSTVLVLHPRAPGNVAGTRVPGSYARALYPRAPGNVDSRGTSLHRGVVRARCKGLLLHQAIEGSVSGVGEVEPGEISADDADNPRRKRPPLLKGASASQRE